MQIFFVFFIYFRAQTTSSMPLARAANQAVRERQQSLLERDELGGLGAAHTRSGVANGHIRNGELTQIVTNHIGLEGKKNGGEMRSAATNDEE